MRAIAALTLATVLGVTACVKSKSVECSDGTVCPARHVCDEIHGGCVTEDQVEACRQRGDGTHCDIAGNPVGVCDQQICITACGDGRENRDELCDPNAAPTRTCLDFGYDIGRIGCTTQCLPELSACGLIGWREDKAATNVVRNDSELAAIWGSSARDIFVSGAHDVMHFDGDTWRQIMPDALRIAGTFRVWGTGPTDVFAAGDRGAFYHWDGTAWTVQRAPTADGPTIAAIWGSSSQDVYAVGAPSGNPGAGAIWHYDGNAWRDVTPAIATSRKVQGIWGSSANDIYAVGDAGTILHLQNGSWSVQTVDWDGAVPPNLTAVTGTSATNIIVVGAAFYAGQSTPNPFLHSDGSGTWTKRPPPSPAETLTGLWAASAGDVYASGGDGTIYHYEGDVWIAQDRGGPSYRAIWGSGPADVLVVSDLHIRRRGMLTWVPQDLPEANVDKLNAIAGESGASREDVFAIGTSSLLRATGSTWTALPAPTADQVMHAIWHAGVSSSGDTTLYVAKNDGVFRVTVPATASTTTWELFSPAIGGTRTRALWGHTAGGSVDALYAVGATGTARWYQSPTPVIQRSTSPGAATPAFESVGPAAARGMFHAIWGSAPDDIWAATNYGTETSSGIARDMELWRYDGSTWAPQTKLGNFIRAFAGRSHDDVYAIGYEDVWHYDGSAWSHQPIRTPFEPRHASAWGAFDAFVVGSRGTAMHSDGTSWVPVSIGTTVHLLGSWASARSMYFVGGNNSTAKGGAIFRLDRSCDTRENLCRDGLDNDCNGLVDCADSGCTTDARCNAGGLCTPAKPIACGATISGTTRNGGWRIDFYRGVPRPELGAEVFYRLTSTTTGPITVTLTPTARSGAAPDLDLVVLPVNGAGACDLVTGSIASSSNVGTTEIGSFDAVAGATYMLAIDGHADAYGDFTLSVACP